MRFLKIMTAMAISLILSACATAPKPLPVDNPSITVAQNDVFTFVPVSKEDKTVYIEINNNSGTEFDINDKVSAQIEDHDYKVINDIVSAHFLLEINIQRIGTIDTQPLNELKVSHFGSSLNKLSLPPSKNDQLNASSTIPNEDNTTATPAMAQNFTIITEIKLYELMSPAYSQQKTSAGTETISQWYNGNSIDWERFYTRIITSAENTTATFDELQPAMQNATANAIGDIF